MNLNEYPLWTAVITPMKLNGDVDYDSLKNILDEQIEAKNGLLILGSTGESLNIDLQEQKDILEFVIKQNLPAPIMVGVGGVNLRSTLEWVEYLETQKVDAYLMVTPLYAKPERRGQTEWFKTLMDKSTRPVMLYNVPSRTGKGLCFDTVADLKDHKNMWAIKEASGSVEDFKKYVATAPNARVYSGDDALLPAFAKNGASGLVSVSSNAWPKATHTYTEQCLNGSLKDESLWEECSNSLFCVSNPIPVKRLMAEEGRIATAVLRAPLTDKDLEDASLIKNSSARINEWLTKQ